jgi:hypothetical protein
VLVWRRGRGDGGWGREQEGNKEAAAASPLLRPVSRRARREAASLPPPHSRRARTPALWRSAHRRFRNGARLDAQRARWARRGATGRGGQRPARLGKVGFSGDPLFAPPPNRRGAKKAARPGVRQPRPRGQKGPKERLEVPRARRRCRKGPLRVGGTGAGKKKRERGLSQRGKRAPLSVVVNAPAREYMCVCVCPAACEQARPPERTGCARGGGCLMVGKGLGCVKSVVGRGLVDGGAACFIR